MCDYERNYHEAFKRLPFTTRVHTITMPLLLPFFTPGKADICRLMIHYAI
jgi:hypothetical protein